jgi:hypothetical protein
MIRSIALIVLIVGLLDAKPAIPKNYDIEADATTIYNDYRSNEARANAKYLNKRLLVHGVMQARLSSLWVIYLRIPDPKGLTIGLDAGQIASTPLYEIGDKVDLICTGEGIVFNLPELLYCRTP